MEVETSDLMLPLIENNFGIGFVPEKIAAPLIGEGKLVQIPIDDDVSRGGLYRLFPIGDGGKILRRTRSINI